MPAKVKMKCNRVSSYTQSLFCVKKWRLFLMMSNRISVFPDLIWIALICFANINLFCLAIKEAKSPQCLVVEGEEGVAVQQGGSVLCTICLLEQMVSVEGVRLRWSNSSRWRVIKMIKQPVMATSLIPQMPPMVLRGHEWRCVTDVVELAATLTDLTYTLYIKTLLTLQCSVEI